MIWGKVLGAMFGFALFNLPGALLGIWLGHKFDRGISVTSFGFATDPRQAKQSFFSNLFRVMGHIAKADGQVSQHEIEMAKAVMTHLRLDAHRRQEAIQFFTEGKQPEFDLDACLQEFRQDCGNAANLIQMFIEIQITSAFANGELGNAERRLLLEIGRQLGINELQMNLLINSVQAQQRFHQSGSGPSANSKTTLNDAYQALSVTPETSDKDVKRAYRKLMAQHHPDKLAAKGLPDEMIEVAKEKTQDIQAAWEIIRKHRNIR